MGVRAHEAALGAVGRWPVPWRGKALVTAVLVPTAPNTLLEPVWHGFDASESTSSPRASPPGPGVVWV